MTIELDDTSDCPAGTHCATCAVTRFLTVQTATTPVGVVCLTLCPSCTTAGQFPRIGMAQAVTMSFEHCAHLGITADEMAEAMEDTDHTIRHY